MGGSGLSDLGAVLLREAPGAPINPDPLTLRSSGEDDSTDLRVLLGRGERWHLMSFGAAAAYRPQDDEGHRVRGGRLSPEPVELPARRQSRLSGRSSHPAQPSASAWTSRRSRSRSGFKGQLVGLGLEGGAEYRSVGKRLERLVSGPASQR